MSDVYQFSPNRVQDHRVNSAIECIANFVERIPEFNVQFGNGIFILSTQKYGPGTHDLHFQSECQNEVDTIAKNIEKYLKNDGFKKVKVMPAESDDAQNDQASGVYFDATAMGWGSGFSGVGDAGRRVLYGIRAIYDFTAEV